MNLSSRRCLHRHRPKNNQMLGQSMLDYCWNSEYIPTGWNWVFFYSDSQRLPPTSWRSAKLKEQDYSKKVCLWLFSWSLPVFKFKQNKILLKGRTEEIRIFYKASSIFGLNNMMSSGNKWLYLFLTTLTKIVCYLKFRTMSYNFFALSLKKPIIETGISEELIKYLLSQ